GGPHAASALAEMHQAWRDAGQDPAAHQATVIAAGCVLRPGEPYDAPRVKAQAGPHATLALHNMVEAEEFGDLGRHVPPALAPLLERYREVYRQYEPADARYLSNHRGHLMFLRPEEEEFCTDGLVRALTLTATKPELQERLRAMGDAGYTH